MDGRFYKNVEIGFDNVNISLFDRVYNLRIHVNADDRKTLGCHDAGRRQADISQAENAYFFHRSNNTSRIRCDDVPSP